MTGIARVRQEIEHAETTAELLDAAYQAFELTMAAIRSWEDSGGAAVAALAFAAAAAGEGRDAIAAAPALPPARPVAAHGVLPADAGEDVASVVAALAGLAGLLAGRLRRAAATAAPGDRAACAAAARHADRIRVLLSGGEPVTSVPVLGDFLSAARRELDSREVGPAVTGAPGRDIAEVTGSVRRFITAAGRHLTDAIGAFGLMTDPGEQLHAAWPEAAPNMLAALSRAATALAPEEPAGWPPEAGRTCEHARRLDAAAMSLTAGRELLGTHFTGRQRSWGHRSGWAPVITSPAVTQALVSDIASLSGQAARLAGRLADSRETRARQSGWQLGIGCQWLARAAAIGLAAHEHEPVADADRDLLYAIPPSAPPRQPALRPDMPVADLCTAITTAAQRAGHAAWLAAGLPASSAEISVTSWREIAASGLAASDHLRLVLDGLASRARELGQPAASDWLASAALSTRLARGSWAKSARALDRITTDVRGHMSPAAAEAARLALLTGLAHAGKRPDAPGPRAATARPPAELAPAREDIPWVLAAVHHAADGLARLAEASRTQAGAAARAGRILTDARTLGLRPDQHGAFVRPPAELTVRVLKAFDDARTASANTAGSVGAIAVAARAPSRYLAAASHAAGAPRREPLSPAADVRTGTAGEAQRESQPGPAASGPLEARLRDLGASPRFVQKAIALDRQARQTLAEAAAEQLSLPEPAPAPTRAQAQRDGLLARPRPARASRRTSHPRQAPRVPHSDMELEAGQ